MSTTKTPITATTAKLEGRVAVITGGASGMGRATALRFLGEGARVVIGDLNEATAKETLEEAAGEGFAERIRFARTDVAEEADVEAMIGLAQNEFGRVDCVFNNAGVAGAIGSLANIEAEDWDYTFAVLARGVFLGIKHGVRAMRLHGEGGSIINTASVAGLSGGAGPTPYSAAKAAVINLSKGASLEFARERIRVNAIAPGGILTPLVSREGQLDPEAMERFQPLPVAGMPEHIASAALFLASEDGAFVTGEVLTVDGGLTAAGPDLMKAARAALDSSGSTGTRLSRGSTGLPPIDRS